MIGVTLQVDVGQNVGDTYRNLIDPDAAVKFLQGLKSYKLLDGNWDQSGSRRLLILDGGATMLETIKTIKHTRHFGYELTEFSGMSRFVKTFIVRGSSQCWFTDGKAGGTHIVWRFCFQPRNLFIAPFLWLFMHTTYRAYMKAAVLRMRDYSDKRHNT